MYKNAIWDNMRVHKTQSKNKKNRYELKATKKKIKVNTKPQKNTYIRKNTHTHTHLYTCTYV